MKKLTKRLGYKSVKETATLTLRWLHASELKEHSVADRTIRNNAQKS